MTEISSWPGMVRSGFTCARPARSTGMPRVLRSGDAATQAYRELFLAADGAALKLCMHMVWCAVRLALWGSLPVARRK